MKKKIKEKVSKKNSSPKKIFKKNSPSQYMRYTPKVVMTFFYAPFSTSLNSLNLKSINKMLTVSIFFTDF